MNKPSFSFGIIADCQYADIPDYIGNDTPRLCRKSLDKLSEAVEFFNRSNLDFVVQLGDLIDQGVSNYKGALDVLKSSNTEVLHVLGNHDFKQLERERISREVVLTNLGLDHPYYSKVIKGWRFIVIDSNEVGLIEHPDGSKQYEEGLSILNDLKSKGCINAQGWNGALSNTQLNWLLQELNEAQRGGQKVVIFSHHPVFPKHRENLLNDDEVLSRIVSFTNLKAYINGHNHDGNYGRYQHLHCLTIKGMVDTEHNAYAIAHVYDDRIEIQGYGRQDDFSLKFNAT